LTHYDIVLGMRYIIKINDGSENLCAEKGVPKVFRGFATAKTIQAVLINDKFWLPLYAIVMSEDTFLTGDYFREKDNVEDLPIRVTDLWEHQKRTVAFIRANGGGLVYLGMGTGKSKISIDLIQNSDNCKAVLIICPKVLPATWRREFGKHAKFLDKFDLLTKYSPSWSVKKRAQALSELVAISIGKGKIPVVTINYDVIYHEAMHDFILSVPWSHIILDESQKIKSDNGKISRAAWSIGDFFDGKAMKVLLSGTPFPHSIADAWSQYRFLNYRVFGKSFLNFQKRYCVKRKLGNKTYKDRWGKERPIEVISHYIRTAEIRKLLFQSCIRYDRDVIKLTEATHNIISIPFEPSARKLYETLKAEMRAIIGTTGDDGELSETGELTVANGLVKVLRLSQMTGGVMRTDDGVTHVISTAKRDAFAEILSDVEPEEPVVVFACSYHEMDDAKAVALEQGRSVGEYSGRIKQLEQWLAGETNVLVLQIRAGGVGIDLTRACICVLYSTGYGSGDAEQSYARCHRPGQERAVSFYHLHVASSIDSVIYRANEQKTSIIAAITAHIRATKPEEEDE